MCTKRSLKRNMRTVCFRELMTIGLKKVGWVCLYVVVYKQKHENYQKIQSSIKFSTKKNTFPKMVAAT